MTKDQRNKLHNFQWVFINKIAKASDERDLLIDEMVDPSANESTQLKALEKFIALEKEITECNEKISAIGRVKERLKSLEEQRDSE